MQLLEQEIEVPRRAATKSVAGESAGTVMFPLVRELAVDGVPVTVKCRVLLIILQPCYPWPADPIQSAT
jgi:putative transposase